MSILLYESFENKKNFLNLRKKVKLVPIQSSLKYKKDKVKFIYVKFSKHLSANFLKKFINLKYIFTPTTGVNHIDEKFCKKKNIKIVSLKNKKHKIKKISSTTELALALIISSIRKLGYYFRKEKHQLASRYEYTFFEFKRYTIGIIGYGRIGSALFKILKNLKFNVYFFDIREKYKKHKNYLPLNKLLKISNIISVHIDYRDENINFFNFSKFKLCKKDLALINTSRGEVIDENSLISFLKKNHNSSAYLDVIQNEQINKKKNKVVLYNKLNKNLFLTPHIGGAAKDALSLTEDIILKDLYKIFKLKQ
jgi:D-3-phosphoglycerate dehydrogenase